MSSSCRNFANSPLPPSMGLSASPSDTGTNWLTEWLSNRSLCGGSASINKRLLSIIIFIDFFVLLLRGFGGTGAVIEPRNVPIDWRVKEEVRKVCRATNIDFWRRTRRRRSRRAKPFIESLEGSLVTWPPLIIRNLIIWPSDRQSLDLSESLTEWVEGGGGGGGTKVSLPSDDWTVPCDGHSLIFAIQSSAVPAEDWIIY